MARSKSKGLKTRIIIDTIEIQGANPTAYIGKAMETSNAWLLAFCQVKRMMNDSENGAANPPFFSERVKVPTVKTNQNMCTYCFLLSRCSTPCNQ